MKKIRFFLLKILSALIFFFLSGHAFASSWTWIPIETIEVDWNADGKKDRLFLEGIKEFIETHEPGDFHRVRIQISGKPEFVLENAAGWVRYRNETKWPERVMTSIVNSIVGIVKYKAAAFNDYKNRISSRHIVLTPVAPKQGKDVVLLLFGYQYASSPGQLTVIELDHAEYPAVVFDKEFDLSRLEDLDNDNVLELIGQPWYGEVFGPDDTFHTYVPTYVYSFARKKGELQLRLNLELSKKFNEEHGYGWVPPEASEKYVIVEQHDGEGSRLMKLEDAERLYNRPGVNEN